LQLEAKPNAALQSCKSSKSTFGSKYRRYFFDDCCGVE